MPDSSEPDPFRLLPWDLRAPDEPGIWLFRVKGMPGCGVVTFDGERITEQGWVPQRTYRVADWWHDKVETCRVEAAP